MNGLNKAGNIFNRIVELLFGVLMVCVLIATVVIDRNIDTSFSNTVVFYNWGYYLAALLLLCGLFYAFFIRPKQSMSNGIERGGRLTTRGYYWALAVIALVVVVLQFIVSGWMPLQTEYYQGDYKYTMGGAWDLAHGGSLEGYSYFKTSPNNLNITIVLSLVYRLLPWMRSVIWVSALLTNASVVLTSLSVYNLTKRENIALTVAVVGEILVGLTWRAFVVYTDNFGMIFVALMLWLYTTRIRPEIKVPLIILCAVCAAYIKITNLVMFAAFAVNGAIRWLMSDGHRLNFRRIVLYTGCTVVLFGLMFGLQEPIRELCGFKPGKYPKTWQYMFMVGQNDKTLGTVGGGNNKLRKKFIKQYKDQKMVNKALFDEAINRIKRRRFLGNIVFYEKKLVVAYNDGVFAIYQAPEMFKMEKSFLYDFYLLKGRYYQIGATIFQILWDGILLVLMVHTAWQPLRWKKGGSGRRYDATANMDENHNYMRLLRIGILGVTLSILLLEGRAKYLFMFLPLFLAAFGLMFHEISDRASNVALRNWE